MNWKEKILFYTKSLAGHISRRSLEPMLMSGCKDYAESLGRLNELLNENLFEREENESHSFRLTEKADLEITPFYNSANELMKLVTFRIEKVIKKREFLELKGGTTGVYFTYTKMTIFRFYPSKNKKDIYLFIRLPNLIGEPIDFQSNEIYISKETLFKTSFLEDIIECHLKMIDEFYGKKA